MRVWFSWAGVWIVGWGALIFPGVVNAQGACQIPPTAGAAIPINLGIVLDRSGSMSFWAYQRWNSGSSDYDPDASFYGYFSEDMVYRYDPGNRIWYPFRPEAMYPPSKRHRIVDLSDVAHPLVSGRILNWALMSRMDIAKRVLVGGKGDPPGVNQDVLKIDGLCANSYTRRWRTPEFTDSDGDDVRFWRASAHWMFCSGNTPYFYIIQNGTWYGRYYARVDISGEPDEIRTGVLRKIVDQNWDGIWDEGAPRMAFVAFGHNPTAMLFFFHQADENPAGAVDSLIRAIANLRIRGWTAVGEGVFKMLHYIATENYTHDGPDEDFRSWRHTPYDPYVDYTTGEPVPCRQTFLLVVGDGASNEDDVERWDNAHFPSWDCRIWDRGAGDDPPGISFCTSANEWCDCGNNPSGLNGDSRKLDVGDDLAFFAARNDLRPDIPGVQNVISYTIFTFGYPGSYGERFFGDMAEAGMGRFYPARTGPQVAQAIEEALYSILERAASTTSLGLVSGGGKGEGFTAMAFYFPRLNTGKNLLAWVGALRGLWVDPFGNLRADVDNDLRLNLQNDPIVYVNPPVGGSPYPVLDLWEDSNGDGTPDVFIGSIPAESTSVFLWSADQKLIEKHPNERTIWFVHNDTRLRLENTPTVQNILTSQYGWDPAEVDRLIDFFLGWEVAGLRTRKLDPGDPPERTWKLGDIIHSSPTFVGPPPGKYHILYGDQSYRRFVEAYRNRRGVFYVGSNDGMIHAFNAGRYVAFSTHPEIGRVDPAGYELGEELWALIPSTVLPALPDVAAVDYCHFYYTDLKPRVADVRAFSPDGTHPEGWGTILVQGMRLGCGPLVGSAYLILDVTDPLDPQVIKEIQDPALGRTTSFPAIARVEGRWFVLMGSGPDGPEGEVSITPSLFVYDLQGDQLYRMSLGGDPGFVGDIAVVDADLDYTVDVVYVPVVEGNRTRLLRIRTEGKPVPTQWQIDVLTTVPGPQVASVNVSYRSADEVWVFGGTGKFFRRDDIDPSVGFTYTPVFYGIVDQWKNPGWQVDFASLVDVSAIRVLVDTVTGRSTILSTTGDTLDANTLRDSVAASGGWVVRLTDPTPQMVLGTPLVFGEVVYFTAFSPQADVCNVSGTGYLWALAYDLGIATEEAVLGLEGGGESAQNLLVGEGIPSAPSLHVGENTETALIQTGTGQVVSVRARTGRRVRSSLVHVRPIPVTQP